MNHSLFSHVSVRSCKWGESEAGRPAMGLQSGASGCPTVPGPSSLSIVLSVLMLFFRSFPAALMNVGCRLEEGKGAHSIHKTH